MYTPVNETSVLELTLRSVGERIKHATDPILRRMEELCALLAKWNPLVTAKRPVRGAIMSFLAPRVIGTTAPKANCRLREPDIKALKPYTLL